MFVISLDESLAAVGIHAVVVDQGLCVLLGYTGEAPALVVHGGRNAGRVVPAPVAGVGGHPGGVHDLGGNTAAPDRNGAVEVDVVLEDLLRAAVAFHLLPGTRAYLPELITLSRSLLAPL